MKGYLLHLFLILSTVSLAQTISEITLDGSEKGLKLPVFIEYLERKYPLHFYYKPQWIDEVVIEKSFEGFLLKDLLKEILLEQDLSFIQMNENAIVFIKDPTHAIELNNLINTATRKGREIKRLTLGNPKNSRKNQKVILSGRITDYKTKKPLRGAGISVDGLNSGTATDSSGLFQLKMSSGDHVVNFSYLNFDEKLIELSIYSDAEIAVDLEEAPTVLDEVVVSGTKGENTTSRINQTQINIREIKRAPSLLGEVDLIKQIQILPGVTTAGEAASGFNVRGGSVDQNLVLYDGIPVFNSSHVFGFFSSFNAEALRDVSFYRGGIPAEYGGRISSVLDIRSKEGNYEKLVASGGVGLISSNILVSAPLKKEKSSVILSLRSTYSNWFINTIRTNYVNLQNSSVFFYDGAVKITHLFSKKTKLAFSGYSSRDQFRLTGDTTYRWSNLAGSLRLDHQFSDIFDATLSVGYGQYGYEVFDKNTDTGFNLDYKINYPTAKAEFHYAVGVHKLTAGIQSLFYGFDPGTLKPSSSQSNIKWIKMEHQQSLENAMFLSDAITLNDKYFIEGGLRLSQFSSVGPATVNLYKPFEPLGANSFMGTASYKRGEKMKTCYGVEPRVSLRYSINQNLSLKVGYNRMYQYLHLVSNTTAITPIDIWQPSGYYFKPQKADQVSLGLFKSLKDKSYEMFAEVYYKKINNILDFKDGAQLILNQHIETDLLQGKGRAYGIETSISKMTGRVTGSINYTYSRSLRKIRGGSEEESINKGKEYASNFDQPNIINLTWKCSISRRFFFTGYFTYHTGRPVTVPESGFVVDHFTVANFSERNQYRIPDYHRLDLALVIEGNHKRKKIVDGTWTLSFYNVYARRNPYTVFFKENGDGVLKAYQLSILGTMLPSLSYGFKF